ncbi:gp60plus39 DNA topoisomerase subunit [Delftia phage PhiW-14]|uniref:DNA topoisomerase 2 n=1 Tax=Delftia phage PhiW-14 TaxID=665032 RepID=C9DGI8_BPW14|nr:DNA topoisomerase II [Delftia phage PhiW-14]ACV50239.1 gp60plus39 DNA topoisomerase subunit [Delftia phage PhiW-14]
MWRKSAIIGACPQLNRGHKQVTQDVSKYKMLSERDHIRIRPGRYLGDINTSLVKDSWTVNEQGQVERRDVQQNPAFTKLFDEIITNSADFSLTADGKHLNIIRVDYSREHGCISVYDNGGIPVVETIVDREGQPTKLWIPDMIFGFLRSGSNFNDEADSESAGQNGEGSTLVNVFSSRFDVETCDGKNKFSITYLDGMANKTAPEVVAAQGATPFTRITYFPEWSIMGMTGQEDWIEDTLRRRCLEVAACNTHIRVYYNGKPVNVKKFGDFAAMLDPVCVSESAPKWDVALSLSKNGFKHYSYVNSTLTFVGGTHINHVMDKIVAEVRAHIESKTKQDIKPAEILNQFQLTVAARINNPRYSSQTKENLITPVSSYNVKYSPSKEFIKAIIDSPMMKKLLEWAERRKAVQDIKEAEKEIQDARKASFHHIPKYRPATNKNKAENILFVAEGDSALKPLQAAKKPHHGLFPLRGKPDNVFDKTIRHLAKQKEFQDLIQILGLDLHQFNSDTIRYSALVVATDADLDGAHIRGLLTVAFWRFWRPLIDEGFLRFLVTPIITVKQGKETIEFFTEQEYEDWRAANPTAKYTRKYYKGLGSWATEDMERFMNDPKYMVKVQPLTDEDVDNLVLAFDPSKADARKSWLGLSAD